MGGARVTPVDAKVRNPAFDVTPNRYVTGIITERGIARAPYSASLAAIAGGAPVAI
jgi:methylthioribose-1-phosphate isomerase